MSDAALAGGFETITSPAFLEDLGRGIADPKLQAVIGDADELVEFLAQAAIVITPSETVVFARDPDDGRLIAAAQTATPR